MQSRDVAGRVICGAPCILGSAPRVLSSQCRSCAAGSSYIWLLGLCRQACHSEHTKGFRTLVFSDLLFFILYLTAVSFRCSHSLITCVTLLKAECVLDLAFSVGFCVCQSTATLSAGFQALTHTHTHTNAFIRKALLWFVSPV